MTTLNARANQAWLERAPQLRMHAPLTERLAFKEGWETGYKTAAEEIAVTVAEFLGQPAGPIAAEIARKLGRGERL